MHHHAPQWINPRNHFYSLWEWQKSGPQQHPKESATNPTTQQPPKEKPLFKSGQPTPVILSQKPVKNCSLRLVEVGRLHPSKPNPNRIPGVKKHLLRVWSVLKIPSKQRGKTRNQKNTQPRNKESEGALHETLEFCSINHMFVTLPSVFHVTNQLLALEPSHFHTPLNHTSEKKMVQLQEPLIVYKSMTHEGCNNEAVR